MEGHKMAVHSKLILESYHKTGVPGRCMYKKLNQFTNKQKLMT